MNAIEGSAFSGVIATGSSAVISGTLTAMIDWGDGSSSPGTVTSTGNGTFTVSGAHTYSEEGTYATSISISDGNGHSASDVGKVTVSDAALKINQYAAEAIKKLAAVAALFTDADPSGTLADYQAVINWGDGTTSKAVTIPLSGDFLALGVHLYAQHGHYQVTLTITDAGGVVPR